jgi:hypothetical protein
MSDTSDTVSQILLDCESFDAALRSVAEIFRCTPQDLHALLSLKELGTHFEKNWRDLPDFRMYLFEYVEKHFGSAQPLEGVYWFHTTRVPPGTTFSEGILPLNAVLPLLHANLVRLVEDEGASQRLRESLAQGRIADHHYIDKTGNSMHWGPYAVLVRDVAFHAETLCQHDYLGMPEIIEDICNGLSGGSEPDFNELFSSRLKPAIVKFIAGSNNDDAVCIATAISYLHSCIHAGAPDTNSVYCFDGDNNPVPAHDIARVDFI